MEISTTSIATATAAAAYGSLLSQGRQLSLALGVEHRRAHGFGRRLARPDHELERRIVAFAGVERADQHGLALRGGSCHPARQYQGLAVHDHAGVGPDVEVPDP